MRPLKTLVLSFIFWTFLFFRLRICIYKNSDSWSEKILLISDFQRHFPRENNDAINVGLGRSKTWLHEFLPWKNSFWILRQGPWMQWWRRIQNQNHAAELYIYELLQRKSQFFLFGSKTVNAEVAQNPKTKIWSWFLGGEDSSSRWKGFFALVRY